MNPRACSCRCDAYGYDVDDAEIDLVAECFDDTAEV